MPAAGGLLTHEALRPGTRLGRYELLIPIATGGMARVWAARQHGQRGFSKLVAIKTILPHLAREREFERMFLDEARIASGVHHPNVCEIYELGEEGSVLYLAMEWVNGDALVHVLRQGKDPRTPAEPIDPRIASRIIADAAAGVHAAHNLTDDLGAPLNVVHRDISPHNILLSSDGNVKVTDFGVAKALGQVHNATSAGQLRGKLGYMPPEQVAGAFVDRRSDVFALGCVLYQCSTGRPPFMGETEAQLLAVVNQGEFPRPRDIVHGYPEELEAIVLRAMAREPIQRFPSAERMRVALEEFLARSGPVVTQSQVAVVVQQRIGGIIEKRREKIRAASANPDPNIAPPPSSSSSSSGVLAAPSSLSLSAYGNTPAPVSPLPSVTSSSSGVQAIPQPQPASAAAASVSDARRMLVAVGIGIAVAVAIGAAVLIVLASSSSGSRPAPAPKPSMTPVRTTATSAPSESTPSATAPAVEIGVIPSVSATGEPTAETASLPSARATTEPAATTAQTRTVPALPANPY